MRKKILMAVMFLPFMSSPAPAKELVFVLVPKSTENVFFEQSAEGCRKAAAELGVRCQYIGPSKVDAVEQVQILQDLIARKVDGISVAPIDSATMAGPLKAAKAAGIPVVTYDSDLLTKDHALRATYVGTNNYAIGENLAQKLKEMKPKGGTICIQTGTSGEANLNERVRGVRDTLAGRDQSKLDMGSMGDRLKGEGGWREVDGCPLMNDGDYTVTVKQFDETLAKYPDLTAFVPVGGWAQLFPAGYREVVGRYKERILNKKTLYLTGDTLPPQMELVAEGLSHVNVGQKPFDMGYKSMVALKDIKEGKKVPDPMYTGLDICTPESAKTCLGR
jgi:ribose transport system substrate-binding protein